MEIVKLFNSKTFSIGANNIKNEIKAYLSNKEVYYFNYAFDVITGYAVGFANKLDYCNKNYISSKTYIKAVNAFLKKMNKQYEKEERECYYLPIFDKKSPKFQEYVEVYKEGLHSAFSYIVRTLESSFVA